ncbi:MAG: hypothetical protein KBT88_09290 [Gammaproteobacteria bacterium]|nr:hypothetical protein [Gammaproteobacteria bacterium]MBQ0839969.1 hypothetical protein [Gammaproteobacteria bacterium]
MNTAKQEVATLLKTLPEDCTLEDVQYHLYVIEKVQRGISRAETEGPLDQAIVEQKLGKWLDC